MVQIVRVEYILSAVHEHDSRELLANGGINFPSLASGFWLFLIQIAVINSPGVLPACTGPSRPRRFTQTIRGSFFEVRGKSWERTNANHVSL